MSQYRFEVHWPSGLKNSSGAVAKAAYINRENFKDERTGKRHDYSKNHEEELLWSGIFVDQKFKPPEWVQDPQRLWNEAAKAEKRRDALECQDAIGNLPHELTLDQNKKWVTDFVRENLTRGTGRVVNIAFHNPSGQSDDRNVHCHMLWTLRAIGPDGFEKTKLPSIDKQKLESLREQWAKHDAKALEKAAEQENRPELKVEAERWKVGHLKLEKQREEAIKRGDHEWAKQLDREPQVHKGPKVTAMERDGIKTRKGDKNRTIEEENRKRWAEQEVPLAEEPLKAKEAKPVPEKLRGENRDIWVAYNEARKPKEFVEKLERKGLGLSRVTAEDAKETGFKNADMGKKYGQNLKEGDYVVVNDKGWTYPLTERNTGATPAEIKEFLKPLDKEAMPSIAQLKFYQQEMSRTRSAAGKALNVGVGITAAALKVVGTIGESISSMFERPLTPEEKVLGELQQQRRLQEQMLAEMRQRGGGRD